MYRLPENFSYELDDRRTHVDWVARYFDNTIGSGSCEDICSAHQAAREAIDAKQVRLRQRESRARRRRFEAAVRRSA